ncbi:hypothetical protein [Roseateles microcysteis]|uniref:hypothetical protein n=1 Tax=Roseateles microcysteis TaxID=3119057 RepID=UPI002FE60A8D
MIETLLSIDPKLAAAAGAVGSALLAACGYIAKIRYERKRTLRSTLFYLLRLRQCAVTDELLVTQVPERVLSAFNSVLAERSLQLNDEETASMLELARPILAAVAERQSVAELQEIRAQLLKSLADLAKDQPILAYRLSAALPEVKLPGDASEVSASDFPAEASGVVEMISRSMRVGFHAEGARQSKRNLAGLIHMASFEVGVLAFLQTYLILRRQDRVKVPDAFFDAIAKPMAASVQELVVAIESAAASEEKAAVAEASPNRLPEPTRAGEPPLAASLR